MKSGLSGVVLAAVFTLAALLGCGRVGGSGAGADASKLRVGMTANEVRSALGEPSPGGSANNLATGQSRERWIYGAGDDALFVMMVNGKVQGFEKKRCTMKDAEARVKPGMTPAQVVQMLGQPDDESNLGGGRAQSFSNKEAAIDMLRVEYENDRVVKTVVIPNSALNSQGSAPR